MTEGEPSGVADVFRVSFVCTGNICRSPMAEAVLRDLAEQAGLGHRLAIESAGTDDWHVGEPADRRTVAALARAGYDGSGHRARHFDPAAFSGLDLVVAFDQGQARILRSQAHDEIDRGKVRLMLEFDPRGSGPGDVPDPYYSDDAMFDRVLEMIERSTQELFLQLAPALRQGIR